MKFLKYFKGRIVNKGSNHSFELLNFEDLTDDELLGVSGGGLSDYLRQEKLEAGWTQEELGKLLFTILPLNYLRVNRQFATGNMVGDSQI